MKIGILKRSENHSGRNMIVITRMDQER